MCLQVYDPVTNTLEDRGQIVPDLSGEARPIVVGPDGRLYGTGSYSNGRVGLTIHDPKLGKVVKNFGPVGPRHRNGVWGPYSCCASQQSISQEVDSQALGITIASGCNIRT